MRYISRDRSAASDQALLALRKVAVLAHWVPDVGVLVTQSDRPPLRVGTADPPGGFDGVAFHPCEFRNLIAGRISGSEHGLAPLIDDSASNAMQIELYGGPRVALLDNGLVRFQFDEEHAVLAFATISSATDGKLRCTSEHRVESSTDVDLDITLLHCAFPTDGPTQEGQIHDHLFDLLVSAAAEEVSTSLAEFGQYE